MTNKAEGMKNNVENEYLQIENGDGGWNGFFNGIRNECAQNHSYTSLEAKKIENKNLNRYRDVNPYDHSRVTLSKGLCDYINANLVVIEKAQRKYILTQGPLPQTTPHFWLMIWEQNCKAIIMLNRVIEKNVIKCHQYWPAGDSVSQGSSCVFNEVGLKVTNISEVKASYFTTTTLRLEELSSGQLREVIHFHYTTWPDFGVPQSPTAFLRFLNVVRNSGALDVNVGPPVVHCSAGIGRSGTFCLVDSCLVLINEMKLENIIVKDILMEMRKYRMGLIQTPDQLRFSYLAVIEGIKKASILNGMVQEDENLENEEYEEAEDDEAPPLPPPRGESLGRSRTSNEDIKNSSSVNSVNSNDHREEAPAICQRKKERSERNQKLDNKVKEMKRKLKDSESWHKFRKSLFHPWSIGCFILGGSIIVYALLAARG